MSKRRLAYRSMPDEHPLTSRQADQLRTDIANVECGLEVIMEQVARLPTRKELRRAALMVMVGDAAITIVSALAFPSREGFWR